MNHDKDKYGEWIPGFNGIYSITKDGCVYSFNCTDINSNGRLDVPKKKMAIKGRIGTKEDVCLYYPPRKCKRIKIPHVILEVYGGQKKPGKGFQVGFFDKNKENWNVDNLFWFHPKQKYREDEHGKWVPGYHGRYSVTKGGVLWSFIPRQKCWDTPFMVESENPRYKSTTLWDDKGNGERRSFHSIVMETYVGPRPDGLVICHNNGNRYDNRLENLRYDTQYENIQDSVKHGVVPKGEKHCHSKYSAGFIREIKKELSRHRLKDISRKYNVPISTLCNIKKGRSWKHL